MSEQTTITITGNESGQQIKVAVEGQSDMPFWNHDLKLQAVLALLSTVDKKDFYDDDKADLADEYYTKIQEALDFALGI